MTKRGYNFARGTHLFSDLVPYTSTPITQYGAFPFPPKSHSQTRTGARVQLHQLLESDNAISYRNALRSVVRLRYTDCELKSLFVYSSICAFRMCTFSTRASIWFVVLTFIDKAWEVQYNNITVQAIAVLTICLLRIWICPKLPTFPVSCCRPEWLNELRHLLIATNFSWYHTYIVVLSVYSDPWIKGMRLCNLHIFTTKGFLWWGD